MAKKAKKTSKKEKSDKGPSAPNGPKSEDIDELSRQFYLNQIKDLETKLHRYQKDRDLLALENEQFKHEFTTEQNDKKEIVTYLRKKNEESNARIEDLNEQMLKVQAKSQDESRKADRKYAELKKDLNDEIDKLRNENTQLSNTVSSLHEFRVKKDELEQQYADLQQTLEDVNQNHKTTLYTIERKQVQDKDRLKKEMITRVNAVAGEFRRVSNQQMAETTKRTIHENVQLNSQLVKLGDKVKDLMAENISLKKKSQDQKIKIDILQKTERALAKKNHTSQRLISLLTERAEEFEEDLKLTEDVLHENQMKMDKLDGEEQIRANMQISFNQLNEKINNLEKANSELENHLKNEKLSNAKLRKVIDTCAVDLANFMLKIDENSLPGLLTTLTANGSSKIREAIERKLCLDSGGDKDLEVKGAYKLGNLGAVPSEMN